MYQVRISPVGSFEPVCQFNCHDLAHLMSSLLDLQNLCQYIEKLRPYRRVNVSVYVHDDTKQYKPLKCIFDADVSTFPE